MKKKEYMMKIFVFLMLIFSFNNIVYADFLFPNSIALGIFSSLVTLGLVIGIGIICGLFFIIGKTLKSEKILEYSKFVINIFVHIFLYSILITVDCIMFELGRGTDIKAAIYLGDSASVLIGLLCFVSSLLVTVTLVLSIFNFLIKKDVSKGKYWLLKSYIVVVLFLLFVMCYSL